MSATVYDVMTTLVFSENTIVDQKAYLIQMRCAHTEVRLCIVQLSCVCLWTNWKNVNKRGTNDVCVQCLHDVHSVTCGKLGILTPLFNCRRLSMSCQLSSSLSCYRSFHSQYQRSYHHQPYPNISKSAQMCDTNLCRTSGQHQSSTGSPLREEVLKIGFACISDCSFVFMM